jgi:hypothetical protein
MKTATRSYTWKEAFDDAHRSAKEGSAQSQTFVGYCYQTGRGISKDEKVARKWYARAAAQGYLDAIYSLAVMNDKGYGAARRNPSAAAKLYKAAALRGDREAQANLAVMLLDGDGVTKDVTAGLHWLRRAANRGDAKAQFNLGQVYLNGEHLRKNGGLARTWLSKAAAEGHDKAKRLLEKL